MRSRRSTWGWITAIVLVAMVVAITAPLGADYEGQRTRAAVHDIADAAAPQIDALIDRDLREFAREQTAQGPVSLLLRAPFAAAASEHDQRGRYRLGVFSCVLLLGLAAYWLVAALDRPWWQKATALAVIMASPTSLAAVRSGHPEDLLATGFLLAGLAAGGSGMAIAAGVLGGLAIATKAWAVLGVAALVIAARGRELHVGAVAVAVALLCTAPLAIANPSSFRRGVDTATAAPLVHPADVWWTLSRRQITVYDGVALRRIRAPWVPPPVKRLVRPVLALVAVLAFALLARRRPDISTLLLALAALLLLRCVLDPGDNRYYHAPFLIAIAAWEVTAFRRLPVITLVAAAVTAGVPEPIGAHRDLANLVYLAWAVPALVVLASATLGRNRPVFVLADRKA